MKKLKQNTASSTNLHPLLSRINTIYRNTILSTIPNKLPVILINEYPKSGGTWLGQMVSDVLNIDFPRNNFPSIRPSIFHGHYLNDFNVKKKIIVWRDGRDIMVSWYYHCLFPNEHGSERLVKISRKNLQFDDYEDIYKNLPQFIEYAFTSQPFPSFSWSEFFDHWFQRKNTVHVKYEHLNQNPVDELYRIIKEITGEKPRIEIVRSTVEKFSFEKLTKRKKGHEKKNSFLRKGIIGDWKNNFSTSACETFSGLANKALINLGYEKNEDWASRLTS